MTPGEVEKAKVRLRKLLNMTVENGCSEDEAESAMRMAAGLATRLGIELDSVREGEQTAAQRKAVKKTMSADFKIHQVMAAQAAAELYGCELFLYNQGRGGLFFIGREENVELAEQTMLWLMKQVELLYKEYLPRGLTQRDRAEYRKTFKAACAQRMLNRAYDMMRKMRTNSAAAQEATGQNALVVQGYFDQLKAENDAFWEPSDEQKARMEERRIQREQWEKDNPVEAAKQKAALEKEMKKMRKRKGPRQRTVPVGNGTSAGYSAGGRVQLRKEVK